VALKAAGFVERIDAPGGVVNVLDAARFLCSETRPKFTAFLSQ
jgi:hypothetical protein